MDKKVVEILGQEKHPITTKDMVRKVNGGDMRTLKPAFNKSLYAMEKSGLVKREDGTPPRWSLLVQPDDRPLVSPTRKTRTVPLIHVFIDVDNIPCLDKAHHYAKNDTFMYAYASPAYNHFKPKANTDNLFFNQLSSNEDLPSAADVMFGMTMSKICIAHAATGKNVNAKDVHFIVVSKDKICHTMGKMHAKEFGITYTGIQSGWEELRLYLE